MKNIRLIKKAAPANYALESTRTLDNGVVLRLIHTGETLAVTAAYEKQLECSPTCAPWPRPPISRTTSPVSTRACPPTTCLCSPPDTCQNFLHLLYLYHNHRRRYAPPRTRRRRADGFFLLRRGLRRKPPMRILIAEDQPAQPLPDEGPHRRRLAVDAVPDGAEALLYLDGADYDAVVLDIMMPRWTASPCCDPPGQGQRRAGAAADGPGRRGRPGGRAGRRRRRLPHQALCAGRAAGPPRRTDPEKGKRPHQHLHSGRSDGGHRRPDRPAGRYAAELSAGNTPCSEYLIRNQGVVLSRHRSKTISGATTTPAAPMWWSCTSAICGKSWTLPGGASCCTPCGAWAGYIKEDMRNISIKWRMTIWFSLLMIAITALMLVFVMLINRNHVTGPRQRAGVHGEPERR